VSLAPPLPPAAPATLVRAVGAGAAADRVGHAFAAGYQAALRALVPALPEGGVASLLATEAGGAHPSAIATRLDAGALTGEKTFASQGEEADWLLVLATAGDEPAPAGGRPRKRLRLVRVPRGAAGVTVEPLPLTPFCPEVRHARVRLTGVRVRDEDVLPGDGWTDHVKPFRTIEDLHVFGAVLAYVWGVGARHRFPAAPREALSALFASLAALAAADPRAAGTHLALAGTIALARRVLADLEPAWADVDEAERARWQRDQGLLRVAEAARAARTAAAWGALAGA
jgi:hypothetical protein